MKRGVTSGRHGWVLSESRGEVVSTILVGILILMGAGFIVGETLFFIRDRETPKKESERQVMMQGNQDYGQAPGTSQEAIQAGQENLPQDQKRKDPEQ